MALQGREPVAADCKAISEIFSIREATPGGDLRSREPESQPDFVNTRETIEDDYKQPDWSHGDQDPSGENADFGRVIPGLEGSFLGEGYLLQGEEGSERISLDKETTTHYCQEEHDVNAGIKLSNYSGIKLSIST